MLGFRHRWDNDFNIIDLANLQTGNFHSLDMIELAEEMKSE